MNRRMIYLEKINPDVALIRKTTESSIEQGWKYVKLALEKTSLQNSSTEIWLNKKYHSLEEGNLIQSSDTRPMAAGLVYLGAMLTGEIISKKTIMQIMKPLTEDTLNQQIDDLKNLLNL